MSSFSKTLLQWYRLNKRNMPWVGETDPYKVWLSEVILQQTRVEQGTAYYLDFIKHYPTVQHLAKASANEVMKRWEGLGYYSRARNMHATANVITQQLKGVFPDTPEGLQSLKGIGKYTANAILAYAYHKPYAVTDGNVLRILSRYQGITIPVNTPAGKKMVEALADRLLDKQLPHTYNQALMDFGSLVCTPRNPDCGNCPFRRSCYAFNHEMTAILPQKEKKQAAKTRYFNFFVMKSGNKVLIMPRHAADIWKALWQFPLIETAEEATLQDIQRSNVYKDWKLGKVQWEEAGSFKQQLTHRRLICRFFTGEIKTTPEIDGMQELVNRKEMERFAFPGVIRDFMKGKLYF
ncbi:MAG TPA: A/G-specific adenine glycosylase [Chitinophagales bacterium]|nr:A/G-specific adenine glycosylase [Chitinophagales bacterium]